MPLMRATESRPTRRRFGLLALLGVLAMVVGLLSPVSARAATYGKPTLSSVSAISGAGALKVSWKGVSAGGDYATTYRVWYGKSSSFSKASYKTVDLTKGKATSTRDGAVTASNNNGDELAPRYILTGLSIKTTYYVWVQPWDVSTNKANGALSSRKSAKTSKYAYSAPVTITAVNPGKTWVELTWRTVTGAPTYRLRATSTGNSTVYRSSGAEGNMVVTGLKPNTKYTFSVSVEQPPVSGIDAFIKMSGESSKRATATTLKTSFLDAPAGLTTRDDPTYQFDKYGQRHDSIDLSWVAPAGFDPAVDGFKVDYAKDQEMKTGTGYFTLWADDGDGVPERRATREGEFLVDTIDPALSGPLGTAAETPTGDSPDTDGTPSDESTEPVAPPSTEPPAATPAATPTATPTVEESITPSPTPTETETPAAEPQESPSTSESPAEEAEQLSVPAAGGGTRYWGRIFGLSTNNNWYLRIKVVRKDAAGTLMARSERTSALMGKTLSAKGFITGTVKLPQGVPASSYVVGAYRGTDLHDQVPLKANGTYQLSVRPGTYYVQASYIGEGNYNTRWASNPATAGRNRTDGGTTQGLAVKVGVETKATLIDPQSTPSHSISGDIDCPGAEDQCSVDVAAMSDWGGTSTVIRQDRSSAGGGYTIPGLPAGKYRLRISHSENRYKVRHLSVTLNANGTVTGSPDGSLSVRPWVKKYTAKISGTKRVGKTLKLSSKAWIASELPTVRAVPRCQWQRNKVNIAGATKCSYKLTSADRGKSVRVRVNNYRYGFESNYSYSKSYRIG